jgi:hypothetical protein
MESILRFHVEAVGVVEFAIPGFGNYRQGPPIAGSVRRPVLDPPLNDGIAHNADAVGVGDHGWAVEKTGLVNPRRARHFPIPVQAEPSRENGIVQVGFPAR